VVPRIQRELELLREVWPEVEHVERPGEDWFKLPRYRFPPGWLLNGQPVEAAPVLFMANASYPTGDPYAFWAPVGLTFGGTAPNNVTETTNPAFGGTWLQFSWTPDGDWRPTDVVERGSNLRVWAQSFSERLEEGV
jgi:hypothetical protein